MKLADLKLRKKQWMGIFFIALASTIMRLIVQVLFMPSMDNNNPSIIVKAGLLPIGFFLFGMILYGLFGIIFVLLEDGLPGSRIMKGLTYGLSFGIMWVIYLLEPLPGMLPGIEYPLADGGLFLISGLLLGLFLGTGTNKYVKISLYNGLKIIIIGAVYTIARYLYYSVFNLYSLFSEKPFITITWAGIAGLWLGVMYFLLSPGMKEKGSISRVVSFGFLVIGINLLVFNLFIPLVFNANIMESIIRTAIDVVPIMLGVYLFEGMKQGGIIKSLDR